jgi:hypothetical protein
MADGKNQPFARRAIERTLDQAGGFDEKKSFRDAVVKEALKAKMAADAAMMNDGDKVNRLSPANYVGDVMGKVRRQFEPKTTSTNPIGTRNVSSYDLDSMGKSQSANEGKEGEEESKTYKKGGKVSSASKRADGIAQRGKTKGRMC